MTQPNDEVLVHAALQVNRTDSATAETRETEKRLRDTTAGRIRPASAAPTATGQPHLVPCC